MSYFLNGSYSPRTGLRCPHSHRGRDCRGQRSGFTLLEVMIAVAIMSVGATGLLALQSANTIASAQSHNITQATLANQLWAQRLRVDALNWRTAGPTGVAATEYLDSAAALGVADVGGWFIPATVAAIAGGDEQSFGHGFRGEPVTLVAGSTPFFCTNLRYRWVMNQSALRVDIRTWWHRAAPSAQTPSADVDFVDRTAATCATGDQSAVDAELFAGERIRAIHNTILIRPAPL